MVCCPSLLSLSLPTPHARTRTHTRLLPPAGLHGRFGGKGGRWQLILDLVSSCTHMHISHMHMTPQATDLSAINQSSILHWGLELLDLK